MASKYLGDIVYNNDFKFQEFVRMLDCTLGNVNQEGLVTGHNCLNIINYLYNFDGMKNNFISNDFKNFIENEIIKANGKQNVREHVKKILMYPRFNYLPWKNVEIIDSDLELINNISQEVKFKLGIMEGKLYAICQSVIKLNDTVYDILKTKYPNIFIGLEKNNETCHITILNSNVVADIGIDIIRKFIENYDKEFTIKTGNIKSTFSEDWSRFSECFVIETNSDYIAEFLIKFNEHFKKNIKMSPHITFAIKSRDLFKQI